MGHSARRFEGVRSAFPALIICPLFLRFSAFDDYRPFLRIKLVTWRRVTYSAKPLRDSTPKIPEKCSVFFSHRDFAGQMRHLRRPLSPLYISERTEPVTFRISVITWTERQTINRKNNGNDPSLWNVWFKKRKRYTRPQMRPSPLPKLRLIREWSKTVISCIAELALIVVFAT